MSEDPQSPAEAGRDLEDPNDKTNDESAENVDTDDLVVATHSHENPSVYWVGNRGAGTAYRVDLAQLDADSEGQPCSCPDQKYRQDPEEFGACKHVLAAMEAHPEGVEIERALAATIRDEIQLLQTVTDSLTQTATAAAADNESATAPTDVHAGRDEASAEDAAERLQEAFDAVLDDMQVVSNDGLVWFQTGRDTPDAWPFPGGDETFSVVTGPDMVMFVHDGSADWADGPHKHHASKPGEWYRNALQPDDVDDYIGEVLE